MTKRNHTLDEVQEDDENAVYVQPNIEHELSKEKRQACRDIVKEIKEFGVNQRQILFLIQLMAMELENGDAMRAINKAVGEVRKEIPVGNKLILTDKD
jgi:hypothetical protein